MSDEPYERNNIQNFFENNQLNYPEVLYSDDLNINGLKWRLKIYPLGNGGLKGEYISVFLELRDGLFETSKYFYKIELENFYSKLKKFILLLKN